MNAQAHPSDSSLVFECDFEEEPEKVWRALTEPQLLEAWLTERATARTGSAEVQAARGIDRRDTWDRRARPRKYEILTAEPHRLLRYRWLDRESATVDPGSREVHSIVTVELTPGPGGGTHMRLTHGEFRILSTAPVMAHARVRPIASAGRRPIRALSVSSRAFWRRAA